MSTAKKFAIYCDTAGCGMWDEEDYEIDESDVVLKHLIDDWRSRGWEISEDGSTVCEDCAAEPTAD